MVLVPVAGSGSHRLRRVLDDLGDAPLCSHPWPAAVQTEVMLRLCWVLGVCGWCLRHGVLCLWTWVTVLCQDIGDTSVGSGGDTCGLRLSGEL